MTTAIRLDRGQLRLIRIALKVYLEDLSCRVAVARAWGCADAHRGLADRLLDVERVLRAVGDRDEDRDD